MWQYNLLHQKSCVTIHPNCYKVCLMHKHPNAMPNYVAIKVIVTISVVASIINCNASLRGNNHDYCNNIKKPLQRAIATLLLATAFKQSHIAVIEMCCNKYGPIATIFYHGNRPIS
jgi:hypothetical protein